MSERVLGPEGGRRLPVAGVMGSGEEPHEALARPLGCWLAGRGVHLLTGGGRGVMRAVCEGFCSVPHGEGRQGLAIGILPAAEVATQAGASDRARPVPAPAGYPNPHVELVIRTHLPYSGVRGSGPRSRNHLNVLSSDVVIALPGGAGTRSEIELCLRYGTPLVAYASDPGAWSDLPAEVPRAARLDAVQAFVEVVLAARSGSS